MPNPSEDRPDEDRSGADHDTEVHDNEDSEPVPSQAIEQHGSAPEGDPTEADFWGPLLRLRKAMEEGIVRLYTERGVVVPPRFTMPLIRLGRRGPMTIRELAESLDVTHSAMSQTVSALKRDDLVTTRSGRDARTREVVLTERALELLPFLEAEWLATEQAAAELDAELPYSLHQVVRDMEAALARRSFYDRIARHLPAFERGEHGGGTTTTSAGEEPGEEGSP